MSQMLHAGAKPVPYEELRLIEAPQGTDTHVPVPHHEVVELMRFTLGFHQHEIAEEHHAITEDGARYFGILSLRSPYWDYTDMRGLRKSHDKSSPPVNRRPKFSAPIDSVSTRRTILSCAGALPAATQPTALPG